MLSGSTPETDVNPRPRSSRLARLPMAEGMLPDIPSLYSKRRICRAVVERLPTEPGSRPVKLLSAMFRSWSWVQFDREAMNSHPFLSSASSSFWNKYRSCRPLSLPSAGGTRPWSMFTESSTRWSVVRLVSEAGMDPVNWFQERLRIDMLGNLLPISAGMVPLSLFAWICSLSSDDRLYRERGGSPER
ncbi:Putative pentatricopeptide repeat-containing protein [Zea mays]|uniref:Putative pentatricopeptide repeat-containing protein n=1 Tax=Zea mays TaxID=4577 RepID=K7VAH9_MAIZE|nr:Putative pentatricopeptide repeat-containing protein [Zea mays]